jgi:hypothetical protein
MNTMHHDLDSAVNAAVAALHDHPPKLYATCTGAGAGLLGFLWRTAGASRTLLGFEFPYDARVFQNTIGRTPASYCSDDAALSLAVSSYFKGQRALVEQGDLSTPVIGLGLTAAVSTDRTRRGADRVHIAVRTDGSAYAVSAQFDSSQLTRREEGDLCDLIALNALLHAAGIEQLTFDARYSTSDTVMADGAITPSYLAPSLDLSSLPLILRPDGTVDTMAAMDFREAIIFPGSFAPLHYGHDAIAEWVQKAAGKSVIFELAAVNADKSTIALIDLAERAAQFRGRWPVIITAGAPLFVDKARHYPGCDFIVGVDTAVRLLDAKYYRGADEYTGVFRLFTALKTRFYVCDRLQNGELTTIDQIEIPPAARGMFLRVPCRVDVSSTALRAAARGRAR